MGQDYVRACVNFRDPFEIVNLLLEKEFLPTGRIIRGGKLDFVRSLAAIGQPATVVSLRRSPDLPHFPVKYIHIPGRNEHETYDTTDRAIRRWLNKCIVVLEDRNTAYPVMYHCVSGKDRTGVVIAVLLMIFEVPRPIIIQEYLWSDGEVKKEMIEHALDGIRDPEEYFDRVDLTKVKANVLQSKEESRVLS